MPDLQTICVRLTAWYVSRAVSESHKASLPIPYRMWSGLLQPDSPASAPDDKDVPLHDRLPMDSLPEAKSPWTHPSENRLPQPQRNPPVLLLQCPLPQPRSPQKDSLRSHQKSHRSARLPAMPVQLLQANH